MKYYVIKYIQIKAGAALCCCRITLNSLQEIYFMDVPLKNNSDLKPLSSLTLQDAMGVYNSFPGKDTLTFRNELCALKSTEDAQFDLNSKTVDRWCEGLRRPRKGNLSPDDMRNIFINVLCINYSGNDQSLLSEIINTLKGDGFNFDTSDIEAAAAVNTGAAISIVFDILSFTMLKNGKVKQLELFREQLRAIADGTAENIPESPAAGFRSRGIVDAPNSAFGSAAGSGSDNGIRTGSAVIKFNAPPVPFDVEYFVRHIKNGKDEFLSGADLMPVNRNIKFERSGEGPRAMMAVIEDVPVDIGFQFKCYAKCDPKNVPQLCELMAAHIDYSHARFRTDDGRTYYSKQYDEELELIATSFVEPDTVWFILPNYTVYATFDPFINNYFLPEFRD